jgi:hypothetical protein
MVVTRCGGGGVKTILGRLGADEQATRVAAASVVAARDRADTRARRRPGSGDGRADAMVMARRGWKKVGAFKPDSDGGNRSLVSRRPQLA